MARVGWILAFLAAAAFHRRGSVRPDEELWLRPSGELVRHIDGGSLLESSPSARTAGEISGGNPGAIDNVKAVADFSVNLAYLPYLQSITGAPPDVFGDIIPGIGLCLSSMIKFGRELLTKDEAAKNELKEVMTEQDEESDSESEELLQKLNGQTYPTIGKVELEHEVEQQMYAEAFAEREKLWKVGLPPLLVGKNRHDTAKDLEVATTNVDFFQTSLKSRLGDSLICKSENSDVTDRFIAIDQKLQLVLAEIERKHRKKGKFEIMQGPDDKLFAKFRTDLQKKRRDKQIHDVGKANKKSAISNALALITSAQANVVLATVMLAKSVVFYAEGSVYAACDAVHRVSNLITSIQKLGGCRDIEKILDEWEKRGQLQWPLPQTAKGSD